MGGVAVSSIVAGRHQWPARREALPRSPADVAGVLEWLLSTVNRIENGATIADLCGT
jgi:hypothetical protein